MGTSLDELLNAEFKEAFDEFDKVVRETRDKTKHRRKIIKCFCACSFSNPFLPEVASSL